MDDAVLERMAKAAIAEMLNRLAEPTPAMVSDGAFQIFRGQRITEDDLDAAKRVWRAMLAAARKEIGV